MDISVNEFRHIDPHNIYEITWNLILQNRDQAQIPIDAVKIGLSNPEEHVHRSFEINYAI